MVENSFSFGSPCFNQTQKYQMAASPLSTIAAMESARNACRLTSVPEMCKNASSTLHKVGKHCKYDPAKVYNGNAFAV